ncbi:mucolipin-1-like [Mercenaria mercenaria]|uniref:mucolipin-1-like n=1 Tax=Mercenaria mercenaria TaxID=6596 RepID=UPI00234F57ED|nr:mucolipin-1-like [Mercenaria mercenaria]
MVEQSTNFKSSKGNWFRKKGSTKDVLPVLLRLFLFSSLKWKEKRCWISGIHLFLLCLHVTKIEVMTVLTFQIGTCRTTVYMTVYEGYNALRHSMLLHWDAIYETLPYPPSPGAFATYTQPDFQERVNYAVQQYFNLESDAMAYFLRLPGDNITINVIYFDLIRADSEIVDLNSYEEHSFEPQLDVGLEKHTYENGEINYTYNITKDLEQINLTTVLNRTLALDISFSLHSLRVQKKQNDARCLQIFGTISFDDNDHNGEVEVELNTNTIPIHCSKMKYQLKDSPQCRHYNDELARATRALVYVTLIVDSFMFLAGVMTLYITFVYKKTNSENPRFREYFWRVQWWNCLSVIGDGFALGGLNGLITNTEEDIYIYKPLKDWDRSMINLGLGCLFTWFSFLRYIRISHKFSLLFKTIRKAALDVLFFMVCVIIIFVGFWASTYVVLGPYHVKFKTKHSTAETLFSIINGDEICHVCYIARPICWRPKWN